MQLYVKTKQDKTKQNKTKQKQPNQKMGRRSKWTLLQRKRTDGQKAHEKMLNITNYQRNEN